MALACEKVLVCIVELCICRITLSIRGLGPVKNPNLNLGEKKALIQRCTVH